MKERTLSLDTAQTSREFMTAMRIIPYDDPNCLFRRYEPSECEDNGEGYPYIWNKISEVRCEEKLFRCEDCGLAYLEDGDILTVHHCNFNKTDCRRVNLDVYCWLHHSQDHEPDLNMRDMWCKYCKGYFLGWPRLHRHIKGIHRPFDLKIPEITLANVLHRILGGGRCWLPFNNSSAGGSCGGIRTRQKRGWDTRK